MIETMPEETAVVTVAEISHSTVPFTDPATGVELFTMPTVAALGVVAAAVTAAIFSKNGGKN